MRWDIVAGSFAAAVAIMLLARIFAVWRKTPTTIFLVAGIIPIVPGVGIYDTTYALFMNELQEAFGKGMETLKIAVAISLGIMCVLLIPQTIFVQAAAFLKGKGRR